MDVDADSQPAVKKQRGAEKQIWLLTYGSSCASITHEMLLSCGLEVDECYTATWRESKYTLLHLQRAHRLRRSAMDKVMQKLQGDFKIVTAEIFGFDSVSCNSKADSALGDHPGFRIMVEKVNKEPIELEWWASCDTKDICAFKKGLLWKHIESTDASGMTNAQLVERVRKWGPIVRESVELKKMNDMLGEHNAALVNRVLELEEMLKTEREFSHELLMKQASAAIDRFDRALARDRSVH